MCIDATDAYWCRKKCAISCSNFKELSFGHVDINFELVIGMANLFNMVGNLRGLLTINIKKVYFPVHPTKYTKKGRNVYPWFTKSKNTTVNFTQFHHTQNMLELMFQVYFLLDKHKDDLGPIGEKMWI